MVSGVTDWIGSAEPASEDLAGLGILAMVACRYDAVRRSGSKILGLRPLDLDGIVPVELGNSEQLWQRQVWGSDAFVAGIEFTFANRG